MNKQAWAASVLRKTNFDFFCGDGVLPNNPLDEGFIARTQINHAAVDSMTMQYHCNDALSQPADGNNRHDNFQQLGCGNEELDGHSDPMWFAQEVNEGQFAEYLADETRTNNQWMELHAEALSNAEQWHGISGLLPGIVEPETSSNPEESLSSIVPSAGQQSKTKNHDTKPSPSQNTIPSPPPELRAYRSKEQRKAALKNDPWLEDVTSSSVKCVICGHKINFPARYEYGVGMVNFHRKNRCYVREMTTKKMSKRGAGRGNKENEDEEES
ncbi:hypothetical protein VKT23_011105 [Stygiomarasmius scandens]|uniref:Uncharacterized protein n=1 Tax=Marasmiellus scandens TaxID=2682957 RepID=A0ABR1JAU7_9AGAR